MIRRPRVKPPVNLKRKLPNPNTKETSSKKVLCVDAPVDVKKSVDTTVLEENVKILESPLLQSCEILQINKSPLKANIPDNDFTETAFQSNNDSTDDNVSKSPKSTTELTDNVADQCFLKPETRTQSLVHVEDCFKLPIPESTLKNHPFAEDFFKSQNASNNISECIETQIKGQINKNYGAMQVKTAARSRVKPVPSLGHRRNMIVPPVINSTRSDESTSGTDYASTTLNRREPSCAANKTINASQNLSSVAKTYGRIRTDSNSSAFSDPHSSFHKSQKNEENRSNARRDFETRFSKGVPEKSLIKMADLIFYNPTTNPMEQNVHTANPDTNKIADIQNIENPLKNEESNNNSTAPVPQLKLNAQGELVLDDKSLEIETTAEQEARKILANSSLIYVDENTGTNGFYKKHKRTKDWTPDETLKFYRCLQTIGTDFSLISQMFSDRSRRDLKLKFKKEEKYNLPLVNKAILHPKMFNIEELRKQLKEEEEENNKETESEQIIEKKKQKKKRSNKTHAARILEMENDIYDDELEFSRARFAEKSKSKKVSKQRQRKSQENELKKCNDAEKVNVNIEASKSHQNKQKKHNDDTMKLSSDFSNLLQENIIKKTDAKKGVGIQKMNLGLAKLETSKSDQNEIKENKSDTMNSASQIYNLLQKINAQKVIGTQKMNLGLAKLETSKSDQNGIKENKSDTMNSATEIYDLLQKINAQKVIGMQKMNLGLAKLETSKSDKNGIKENKSDTMNSATEIYDLLQKINAQKVIGMQKMNLGLAKLETSKSDQNGIKENKSDTMNSATEIYDLLQENKPKKINAQKMRETLISKIQNNEKKILELDKSSVETPLTNNLLQKKERKVLCEIKVESNLNAITNTSNLRDKNFENICNLFTKSSLSDNDLEIIVTELLNNSSELPSTQHIDKMKKIDNKNNCLTPIQTNSLIAFYNDHCYISKKPEFITSKLSSNDLDQDKTDIETYKNYESVNLCPQPTDVIEQNLLNKTSTNSLEEHDIPLSKLLKKNPSLNQPLQHNVTDVNIVEGSQIEPDNNNQLFSSECSINNTDEKTNIDRIEHVNSSQAESENLYMQRILEKNNLVLVTTTDIKNNIIELRLHLSDKATGELYGKLDLPRSILLDIMNRTD
ncbi:transcription factor TFIIIB component B'' homolog isoform X2 [Teleopsis dalmanni]|uniref:transcription factor TFIIIB component B'' homolog isoform X2 n=1 Tax=Teleopsis dalmanni TaxID=139649 RepID=UPI0018CC9CE0|nr:transcription factor TFIIIB component B'' homolog isoform X2 [Teleopsis dalmanni]